jgi:LysM repeat protein
VYIVRAGDTLRQIARLFQVSVSQILGWNGMHSETQILKGQKLTIRVASRGG